MLLFKKVWNTVDFIDFFFSFFQILNHSSIPGLKPIWFYLLLDCLDGWLMGWLGSVPLIIQQAGPGFPMAVLAAMLVEEQK